MRFSKPKISFFLYLLSLRLPKRIAFKIPLLSQLRRVFGWQLRRRQACLRVRMSGNLSRLKARVINYHKFTSTETPSKAKTEALASVRARWGAPLRAHAKNIVALLLIFGCLEGIEPSYLLPQSSALTVKL